MDTHSKESFPSDRVIETCRIVVRIAKNTINRQRMQALMSRKEEKAVKALYPQLDRSPFTKQLRCSIVSQTPL